MSQSKMSRPKMSRPEMSDPKCPTNVLTRYILTQNALTRNALTGNVQPKMSDPKCPYTNCPDLKCHLLFQSALGVEPRVACSINISRLEKLHLDIVSTPYCWIPKSTNNIQQTYTITKFIMR